MTEQQVREIVNRVVDGLGPSLASALKQAVQNHPEMQRLELMAFSDAFMGGRKGATDYKPVIAGMKDDQRQAMVKEVRRHEERTRPLTYADEQAFVEFCRQNKKRMPESEARALFHRFSDNPTMRDFFDEMRHPSTPQYV